MIFIVCIIGVVLLAIFGIQSQDKKVRQFSILAVVFLAIIGFAQTIVVVPAGHVGVVDVFGKVSKRTLKAGVNLVNPFAKVIKFSIKTQELKETMEVPSQEGLIVGLEVSVLYHLNPEMAAEVYRTIGTDFAEIILIPQFRSVVRGVTGSYEAKALYTSARKELSDNIQTQLSEAVGNRGIAVEKTPLRSIKLPSRLTQAIEEKLQADQESQRMEFVLLKEKQEADRKRIEAQGIADFQNIVTKGISEPLLRWKGIEATEKLANSTNAKVVIVGGKDGLPLILGSQ